MSDNRGEVIDPEAPGRYAAPTRSLKDQIFGLNAKRVFGVDVRARLNEPPADYLSRMKMAYLDDGAAPSHRGYG